MIRALTEADIPEARRIVRLAFGTFLGVPDPENFATDMDYVGTRWRADPDAAFVAEIDGQIIGSNFATRWGSVGFFGPLTVRPDYWNKGVAQQLMEPVMERFANWKLTHAGLFTFAESPKHISLYQKYGFYPRFLTAIMSKPVGASSAQSPWSKVSDSAASEHDKVVQACSRVTDTLYPGLNIEREIRAVQQQGLGETVLVRQGEAVSGFAVCHCGPGTEAGNGKCYVKFGAVLNNGNSADNFDRLLNACEELAASRGLTHIEAGVNMSRHEAYRRMLERDFRIERTGVAMHRPIEPGYSRNGLWVIDDWR